MRKRTRRRARKILRKGKTPISRLRRSLSSPGRWRQERHRPSSCRRSSSRALAAAKRADAERKSGIPRQPLHGIPYAAKDLLDTKGVATTWGSLQFKDRIPSADATAIARLAEAGAILVGKLAM